MLKRFENDQVVAAAEKEFKQAQEIEAAFVRDSEKTNILTISKFMGY